MTPATRLRKKDVCRHVYLPYCTCYQLATEPNESCDIHGYDYPRCDCGRFVSVDSRPAKETK